VRDVQARDWSRQHYTQSGKKNETHDGDALFDRKLKTTDMLSEFDSDCFHYLLLESVAVSV
jgi:hypothetical protein